MMTGSVIWRVVGALVALLLVVWIVAAVLGSTTVDIRYSSAPRPPATVYVAPAAPAAAAQDYIVDRIGEKMVAAEQRQVARDGKQDERIDDLGRRIESLTPTATTQCRYDCVTGVQLISPNRN